MEKTDITPEVNTEVTPEVKDKHFELFDQYKIELEADTTIDDFNIKDTQLKMPAIKHKWVARLIRHRFELEQLKTMKAQAIQTVMRKVAQEVPVKISERGIYSRAEGDELVKKIESRMKTCELLIEYLERVEKVLLQVTYDIKNIIELRKLEMT